MGVGDIRHRPAATGAPRPGATLRRARRGRRRGHAGGRVAQSDDGDRRGPGDHRAQHRADRPRVGRAADDGRPDRRPGELGERVRAQAADLDRRRATAGDQGVESHPGRRPRAPGLFDRPGRGRGGRRPRRGVRALRHHRRPGLSGRRRASDGRPRSGPVRGVRRFHRPQRAPVRPGGLQVGAEARRDPRRAAARLAADQRRRRAAAGPGQPAAVGADGPARRRGRAGAAADRPARAGRRRRRAPADRHPPSRPRDPGFRPAPASSRARCGAVPTSTATRAPPPSGWSGSWPRTSICSGTSSTARTRPSGRTRRSPRRSPSGARRSGSPPRWSGSTCRRSCG